MNQQNLNLEDLLEKLGRELTPDPAFPSKVMERVDAMKLEVGVRPVTHSPRKKLFFPGRLVVTACLTLIAVFLYRNHFGSPNTSETEWWLGSSSVYATDITEQLEQSRIHGIIFQNRTEFVMDDGTRETSSTRSTYYMNRDRYRLNIYDNDQLREIQWYVPEGNEMIQTSLQMRDHSTQITRHPSEKKFNNDPISQLLNLINYLDQSTKKFEPKEIEGKMCIGFEIEAKKLSKVTSRGNYQIWFDTKTKKPVQLIYDRSMSPNKAHHIKRMITVMDHFEWNPKFPKDTFEPEPVKN